MAPHDKSTERIEIGRAASVAGTGAKFKRVRVFGDRIYGIDSGNNGGSTQTSGSRCATLWKGGAPDMLDGDTT